MLSIKPKTPIFILVILISVSLFTGIATADDFKVSNEDDFRKAIAEVNNATPGGSHTILIHNNFNFTNYTQEEHDSKVNYGNINICIPLTYQGTLTIKSAVAGTSYTIGEKVDPNASPYNTYNMTSLGPTWVPALYLGLIGNDTTVIFEDIIFDGVGIDMGYNGPNWSHNLTVKNAHVINHHLPGFFVHFANDSIIDNVTVSNCVSGEGSGIWISHAYNITIKDSDIVNNKAIGTPANSHYFPHKTEQCGGGIYMNMSTVEICGNTNITGNSVNGDQMYPRGGGI